MTPKQSELIMAAQHEVESTKRMCNYYLEKLTQNQDELTATYAEFYLGYKQRWIQAFETYQALLEIVVKK